MTKDLEEAAAEIDIEPELGAEEGAENIDSGGEGEALNLDESGGQSITDRLFSTEPDTPLEQIESPWNPEKGGVKRVYRGVQKAGGMSDGVPAILDIVIGIGEMTANGQLAELINIEEGEQK